MPEKTNNNETILHELLMLQKESNERDTRIEGKMDSLDTRMKYIEAHSEKQDIQLDRLADILSNQRSFSEKLATLEKNVEAHAKTLENQNNILVELKNKSGKIALSAVQTIGGIILTALLTGTIGLIFTKITSK